MPPLFFRRRRLLCFSLAHARGRTACVRLEWPPPKDRKMDLFMAIRRGQLEGKRGVRSLLDAGGSPSEG